MRDPRDPSKSIHTMAELRGAVWSLNVIDQAGLDKKIDWISSGSSILSRNCLALAVGEEAALESERIQNGW